MQDQGHVANEQLSCTLQLGLVACVSSVLLVVSSLNPSGLIPFGTDPRRFVLAELAMLSRKPPRIGENICAEAPLRATERTRTRILRYF